MSRQPIPKQTETQLLLNCRRRCAICFGLHRDNRVKQGQLAHLNQKHNDHAIENLCFLCFDHHDQYDSKTSQSKKLTLAEVKAFKAELEQHISIIWNNPIISIGEIKVDIFTGKYVKGNEFTGASLAITLISGNLIQVKGFAFFGQNFGELDFVSELEINKARFTDSLFDKEYELELEFLGDWLSTKEKHLPAYFGHNVEFEGEYRRLK